MPQPSAVIVAHGFPSDPGPQETVMQALAARVGDHLPGWVLRGATLAAPGALDAALEGLDQPLVYPFFMAEGWFTGTELPRRLDGRGRAVAPFGVEPDLPYLCARIVADILAQRGWQAGDTALLLAAHGSQRSRTSADSAFAMAQQLRTRLGLRQITCGFVEEAPYLADAAKGLGQAICLPFFALRAGHVIEDIPQALQEAQFAGALLPPLGEDAGVPELIARSLQKAARP
ncbi:sirohydrochlorin chelatase [Lacimonas salitolerans]|uniref:Sirohydrochlorin chelatase n=1 Tax=Lacimonas salitolerans TaxID=1323750 RepID=A0ABW4EK01_9RHOB